VTRFVGDGQPWSPDKVAAVAEKQLEHWRRHGFGWRVATERDSERQVGLIALNYTDGGTAGLARGEHEIGWWMDPAVWGRGYACEGAQAVREEARSRLEAPGIVARIQPANTASIRVAQATALTFEFATTGPGGEPVSVYRLRM
jgi:RimJ/RimL family protein N-acetyltransferase